MIFLSNGLIVEWLISIFVQLGNIHSD